MSQIQLVLMTMLTLGGANAATAADLAVGDKAPEFTLPGTTAEAIQLSDYLGKKAVVLFFYIGAFSKG